MAEQFYTVVIYYVRMETAHTETTKMAQMTFDVAG